MAKFKPHVYNKPAGSEGLHTTVLLSLDLVAQKVPQLKP